MKYYSKLTELKQPLFIITYIAISIALSIPNQVQAEQNTLEELVVTGKRPGPRLWKVQHGDNILWIMGIREPLSKSLKWDDVSVKHAIKESKVLLTPPVLNVSVTNPFKMIGIFRKYKKLQKLPNGTVLFDVLSSERQQRYQKVIDKYNISINKKTRPLFVVEQLNEKASKRLGLEDAERIRKRLHKLAKTQNVEILDSTTTMNIEHALKMLENVGEQAELECFDATLEKLDQSVDKSINMAQAWADGDHIALTKFALNNDESSCTDALLNSTHGVAAKENAESLWLSQARAALRNNKVSFSYLSISQIVSSDGLVSTLKRSLRVPTDNME